MLLKNFPGRELRGEFSALMSKIAVATSAKFLLQIVNEMSWLTDSVDKTSGGKEKDRFNQSLKLQFA